MAAFGPVRAGLNVRNLIGRNVRRVVTATTGHVFELTRQARAGVAVMPRTARSLDRLTLSLDVDLTTAPFEGRDERHVAGGAEAWLRGRRLALRGGAGVNMVSDGGMRPMGRSASRCRRFSDVSWMEWPVGDRHEDRNRWGFDLRVTF